MKRWQYIFSIVFLCVCGSASALPWDYETKSLDNKRYQTVLQALAGNYLKHSQNYHFWRISMYEYAWNRYPDSLLLYDALAVSYYHTGQYQEAIRMMVRKEKKQSGIYSTYANFVSFYLEEEKLYKARFYAQKLLKEFDNITPRERYQAYLVDYLLSKRRRGKVAYPIQGKIDVETLAKKRDIQSIPNFSQFLRRKIFKRDSLSTFERDEVLFALLQNLRFSDGEDLLLIEAIGDELLAQSYGDLAAFAYLRAAQIIRKYQPEVAEAYDLLGTEALLIHKKSKDIKEKSYSSSDILVWLALEIQARDTYLQPIFAQEKEWLNEGLPVDSLFIQNYLSEYTYKPDWHHPEQGKAIPSFISISDQKVPDLMLIDPTEKEVVLAAMALEDSLANLKDAPVIVSRIDRKTSLTVGATAIFSLVVAIGLYFFFRKNS